MSIQIDLSNTETINFNNQDVNVLQLNGNSIWEKEIAPAYLNYTGLDENGTMEYQNTFNGNIVAYAIGDPRITSSGEVIDGVVLSYARGNGYNSAYFGGYNFASEYPNRPQIIDSKLVIPNKYNGKPVIRILDNAFLGINEEDEVHEYQCSYIREIIFGNNLKEIGAHAFSGSSIGYDPNAVDTNYGVNNLIFPNSLNTIGYRAFYETGSYIKEFSIPENSNNLNRAIFDNATGLNKKLIYKVKNNNILPNEGINTGILDGLETIVFEKSVEQLNGAIIYMSSPTFVFKHDVNDNIVINIDQKKTATQINIYTDCLVVRNFDWGSKNITPVFYALSEYVE